MSCLSGYPFRLRIAATTVSVCIYLLLIPLPPLCTTHFAPPPQPPCQKALYSHGALRGAFFPLHLRLLSQLPAPAVCEHSTYPPTGVGSTQIYDPNLVPQNRPVQKPARPAKTEGHPTVLARIACVRPKGGPVLSAASKLPSRHLCGSSRTIALIPFLAASHDEAPDACRLLGTKAHKGQGTRSSVHSRGVYMLINKAGRYGLHTCVRTWSG